ncbi:hypothetical protein SISNIDRAFT_55243 [Sistotremastrum niveocremeum HHB9708]|uniref:Uncharacterized protein n=1 Tax=Sistotremastrum niveocremeum HHB9708 TaxID=1314777 RepID=A0A164VC15_9AGAM|nr:hypothetical protein SISNIDRAFT_55243 [Sistotremastrum niveocremeum HHB9708]
MSSLEQTQTRIPQTVRLISNHCLQNVSRVPTLLAVAMLLTPTHGQLLPHQHPTRTSILKGLLTFLQALSIRAPESLHAPSKSPSAPMRNRLSLWLRRISCN